MSLKHDPTNLARRLKNRSSSGTLRHLSVKDELVDFSSNDYLGLARSESLKIRIDARLKEKQSKQYNGSGGSRLLKGNSYDAEQLEDFLAKFHDTESALLFNSGYDANLGLIGSLAGKDDLYLYDELIHASMHDGMKLSQAEKQSFPHNDVSYLEAFIPSNSGDVFLLTESIFSMDGDEAPLKELTAICKSKGWYLIVDEAHAMGIKGGRGEGLLQSLGLHNDVFARIITFGKGPGVHGAAILGNNALKSFLINFARPLIYSTALPLHSLIAIEQSYLMFSKMNQERKHLHEISMKFHTFAAHHFAEKYIHSSSAIHCIVIVGNETTRSFATKLQDSGLDIRPILSPTVPRQTERIRICLHAFNTSEELSELMDSLLEAKKYFSI
ncbi:MAG: aminotransferase class I/II-fold pyridoxal phosphate-dependent enzyme [Flavobacteriales bacterium]